MAKKEPQRRHVTVVLAVIYDGMRLEHLIEEFPALRERAFTENISDLYFNIEQKRGYYDDVETTIQLLGTRPETDDEYTTRLAAERAQRSNNEQWERETWERLNKKFGNKE